MPREPESEGREDSAASPGPNPWPPRDSSPEQVNRLVQQEMSHLKALKRLSIGSTFASPGDPDLPDFDPEAEFDMDASGDSGAFVRKASLHKQPSIRRERSVPTTRRERRKHSQPFRVDPAAQPSSASAKPNVEPGLDNIWVPAGVHPELAPNEWRTFVNDKMAEIRNSQEQQQLSRGSRHQSRLSHEVADLEEYVDASAILDKRRRSASSGEKRRSILDLSREFAGDAPSEDPAPRRPSDPVDARDIADAFQPPDLRPLGGATSLRRSTHRMRRPASRGSQSKPTSDTAQPASSSLSSQSPRSSPVSTSTLASASVPNLMRDSPSDSARLHASSSTTSGSGSPMHFSPSASASASATSASTPSRQHSRSRLFGKPPLSVSISAAKAVATTAEQPPSPSAVTPSPTASTMLRYRRRRPDAEGHSSSRLKSNLSDSPTEVPERDPSRPPLSHVIATSSGPAPLHSPSPSPSDSDSNSDAEVAPQPRGARGYEQVDPANSMDIRSPAERSVGVTPKADLTLGFTKPDHNAARIENKDVPNQGGSTSGSSANLGGTFGSALHLGNAPVHESMGDAEDAGAKADKPSTYDDAEEKSKSRPEKVERRWRWLDTSSQKESDSSKDTKAGRPKEGLTLANLFKKRDTKRDAKREREREKEREHEHELELEHKRQEQRTRDHEREREREPELAHVPLTPTSVGSGNEAAPRDANYASRSPANPAAAVASASPSIGTPAPVAPVSAASSASSSAPQTQPFSKLKSKSKMSARAKPQASAEQPPSDSQLTKSQNAHLSSLAPVNAPRRPRGHMRADSRTNNRLAKEGGSQPPTPQTVKVRSGRQTAALERSGRVAHGGPQSQPDMPMSAGQPEIKLPYDIPAHQISDRSYVMMYHRFPLHIERAIYRLSHMKLANPRRPLRQQVLLSNFMYAYLNLINYGYQQQQLQEYYSQQQGMQGMQEQGGFGGRLEAEQLEQLKRIETKNYDEAMYNAPDHGDVDSSSSSEDEAEMAVDVVDDGDEATYLFKTA